VAEPTDEAIAAALDGTTPVDPPEFLEPGEEAIVSVWRDGSLGAVMSIFHEPEDDEEPFSVDISVYLHGAKGWEWWSTGGSDWPMPYGERRTAGHPELTGFAATLPKGDPRWLWTGCAPSGCERVRVTVGSESTLTTVDSRTGAFIAALPYPAPSDALRCEGGSPSA
jgi:hypothetical protein